MMGMEGKTLMGYPVNVVSSEDYQRGIDARRRFILDQGYSYEWRRMVPVAKEITGMGHAEIEDIARLTVRGSFSTSYAVERLIDSGRLPKLHDPHPSIAGMVAVNAFIESHGRGDQIVIDYVPRETRNVQAG